MTELYLAARRYVGTPWDHRGRTSDAIDCIGLAVTSARDCGWEVIDVADYSRRPTKGRLEAHIGAHLGPPVCVFPTLADLLPSDVVTMRYGRHGRMRHVGVVAAHPEGGLSLIHADGRIGRVVEQRIDAQLISFFVNVYRRHA
jgi:hypothetical protein